MGVGRWLGGPFRGLSRGGSVGLRRGRRPLIFGVAFVLSIHYDEPSMSWYPVEFNSAHGLSL